MKLSEEFKKKHQFLIAMDEYMKVVDKAYPNLSLASFIDLLERQMQETELSEIVDNQLNEIINESKRG